MQRENVGGLSTDQLLEEIAKRMNIRKEIQSSVKVMNAEEKMLREELEQRMVNAEQYKASIADANGAVVRASIQRKRSVAPLTEDYITDFLVEQTNGDRKRATAMVDALYNSRPVICKNVLVVKLEKSSSGGAGASVAP
jgi:hypothetical protein